MRTKRKTFMKEDIMDILQRKVELPRYALTFAGTGTVEGKQITMTANSGRTFSHPYWRQLTLDLSGMTIKKDRLPILLAHNPDRILGYFDKSGVRVNGSLNVTGQLIDTAAAREFSGMINQGQPFEASLYGKPTEIQSLSEDEETEVNGRTVKGPGSVWKAWTLKECGPSIFGMDPNTSTDVFAFAGSLDKETCMIAGINPDEILAEQIFLATKGGSKSSSLNVSPEDAALACQIFKMTTGQGAAKLEILNTEDDRLADSIFAAAGGRG